MYIDETGIDHQIMKEHCWSAKGQPVVCEKAGKARGRTSLIAGLCNGKVIAPMCFEGHTNTEVFINWLEKVLIPELRPGQVVIMDNASFHKSKRIQEIIAAHGCHLLYLPPYSPDLNPIEHYWAWLKKKIRYLRLKEPLFYNSLQIACKLQYHSLLS